MDDRPGPPTSGVAEPGRPLIPAGGSGPSPGRAGWPDEPPGDVDVLAQGTDALERAWPQVKSEIGALADAARAQHSEEVQQVKKDSDALDAALDQARGTQALLASVSSSC